MATLYLENAFCEWHYIWWCDRVTWKNFCWPIVFHTKMLWWTRVEQLILATLSHPVLRSLGEGGWQQSQSSLHLHAEEEGFWRFAIPPSPFPNFGVTVNLTFPSWGAAVLSSPNSPTPPLTNFSDTSISFAHITTWNMQQSKCHCPWNMQQQAVYCPQNMHRALFCQSKFAIISRKVKEYYA